MLEKKCTGDSTFLLGNVRFEQQASILHCPVPIDFFAAIAPSIQQCSGYFSHNAGEITLSNYKLALGESTSCLWLIDANSDEYIRMNLEEFGVSELEIISKQIGFIVLENSKHSHRTDVLLILPFILSIR